MAELHDLLLQVRNRLSSSSRQDQFLEMIQSAEESLRLLGTNNDPIRTKELLRAPSNQCQMLLHQKRQEIVDLHRRLGALEEEERELVNLAEKIKTPFSYIQRCPPEVISEIFLNCVDFYHATDIPNVTFCDLVDRLVDVDKAPLLLLRICKKWRYIALNTPKLFTQLYLPHRMIERGKEEMDMDSVLHLFLTCSGSLALDIFLQINWGEHFSFRRMDMVSALLSPCFSRICRIVMPWNFLLHLFPQDSFTEAPALLSFQLSGGWTSVGQFGRLVAPKLKIFSSPADFNWEGFITFGECLKIFSGCSAMAKQYQLFQNSSNMEYCHITDYMNSTSQLICDVPIFLPQLQDLSINTSSKAWIPLLSRLKMPSLHALQLEVSDYGPESILGGIISSFISARPSLKELHIKGARIEYEEFHDLLHILPELTTMTLNCCEIYGGRALRALLVPDVCPKLATLDLTGSILWYPGDGQVDYNQDIKDITCSRACSRLSEDPEERTQRCLRYINLCHSFHDFSFSNFEWKMIRRLGNEYDIIIAIDGGEEENEGEHSGCNVPSGWDF